MNDVATVPPAPDAGFKDRRTGLMIFGILLIVLGCLVALMIPLMLLGQFMARQVPGLEPTPMRFLLPGVLTYLGLSVAFIWLGIGSMQCRRWARALLLILSWMWLICGIAGSVAVGFIIPQVFAHPPPGSPPLPAAARVLMTLFALAFTTVIYVVIPGVLLLFYRSHHVKATCDARDPVPRWTDACPLPVLAISLLLGCGAFFMPLMIAVYNSVVPFFGCYVTGLPGATILLATAVVWAWAARATYRLQIAGWWAAFLGFGIWMFSAGITFARIGLLPMYELIDFPKAPLDMVRQMGFLQSPLLGVLMVACWLPFLGYVVFTKRYFRK
jgi:hypothetical protein